MKAREVRDAKRKTRRDIKTALSNDFNKYLAEIILNADDSYKRIENAEEDNGVKEIRIHIDRKKRMVTIVDDAEGMTAKEMDEKFGLYGADHAQGDLYQKVRGLFGQGASDVLFACALSKGKAEIKSIKDRRFHTCKFFFKDKKYIQAQSPKTRVREARESLGIKQNGTAVMFELPKEVSIPRKKDIRQRIESFHMFRYILSNPKRRVLLYDGDKEMTLSSKQYSFDQKRSLLKNHPVAFRYEQYEIKGILDLVVNPDKKHDKTHVIVKDERDAVYDNTLFGLEKYPGAHEISGELTIQNLYNILHEKLNDPENPLQILTDTRDGFDQRNDFTKKFFDTVSPVVEQAINKHRSGQDDTSMPLERLKRFKDALKKINEYYNQRMERRIGALSPGSEPPADGLQFARQAVSITEGKRYVLQLFVNANMLEENKPIFVLGNKNPYYAYHPKEIVFDKNEANEKGLVVKSVRLSASSPSDDAVMLEAKQDDYETNAHIKVVEEEMVYPEYGLEFIPANYVFKPNKTGQLKLYVDTDKYPIGTEIDVSFVSQQTLFPDARMYRLEDAHIVQENTALLKIPFMSDKKDIHYTVKASAKDQTAKARIKVREKEKKDEGKSGFLNSIQLVFEDDFWQTSFSEKRGIIYINGNHPINRNIMGDLRQKDPKKPSFSAQQNKYLFELIAIESAKGLVKNEFSDSSVDTPEKILDFLQKEKTAIYGLLMDES